MKICENKKCGKEHDGTYGSGKFCSRSCRYARMIGDSNPSKLLYVKQMQRERMLGSENPMRIEASIKKHSESMNTPQLREKRRLDVLGDKNPAKRPDVKIKRSISLKEAYKSQELRNKISLINKGKPKSDETKRKLRLARIKQIERSVNDGSQVSPNFNPNACKIIDEYGKVHGYNFKHAMNGGEFYILDLGYWVDGYDKEKNIVIEYYEKKHENTKERDEKRKQEIVDHLQCDFIELKEGWL